MVNLANLRTLPASIKHAADNATKVGTTMPDSILEALSTAQNRIATIDSFQASSSDVSTAVLAAIDANEDPANNTNVASTIQRYEITERRHKINDRIYADLHEALTQSFDDIIEAFRIPYANAGDTFAAAHLELRRVGMTGVNDPSIVNKPIGVAESNVTARKELATVRTITGIVNGLRTYTYASGPTRHRNLFFLYDTGDQHIGTIPARNISETEAVEAGYTFSLATTKEATARQQHAIQLQAAAAAVANENAKRRAAGAFR